MLELNVSKGDKLYFLVDSGADISLVTSHRLLGTAEFEPRNEYESRVLTGRSWRPTVA